MKKLVLLLLLAAAGGLYHWQRGAQDEALPPSIARSNGRLELQRYDVATLQAGRVVELLADEGDRVQKEQLLARLSNDISGSQLALAEAQQRQAEELVQRASAGRAQAEAGLNQAQSAITRATAEVSAQKEVLKVAQLELRNAQQLRKDNLVAAAEVSKRQADRDRAAAAVKASEALLASAKASREQAAAALAAATAQIDEAKAGVAQAAASVQMASNSDGQFRITSPIAGQVEYRISTVGSVLGAGGKVFSLLDPSDVSMNIFLVNGDMAPLRVGDEARIVLDGIDAVFPATVSRIASEAQFTPKMVETQSERAKLMFKVKLKIPADTARQFSGLLKGGLSGDGYVRLDGSPWPAALAVRLLR